MEYRILGAGGPSITCLGLGTWAIGGPWAWGWGPQSDTESLAAIQTALQAGIAWIDTAPVYGLGHAEEIVGQAIRGHRHEVFIATKCGLVWDARRRIKKSLRPESIRAEIDASLRRLQIDCIDLYQHHWPDPYTPVEDSWGELMRLQEAGKIKYIGVCNYDVELLQACLRLGRLQSLQIAYSLLQRDIERELIPFCRRNAIGILAYGPLQSGLLGGRFDASRLAPDDWRRKEAGFRGSKLEENLNYVAQLSAVASRLGVTVAQLALAWVIGRPGVSAAIVGARNASQAAENAGAASITLPPDIQQDIARIVGPGRAS